MNADISETTKDSVTVDSCTNRSNYKIKTQVP